MTLDLIGRVSSGEDVSLEEMADAINQIMRGQWQDSKIAMLLTALHHKGESVDEVAGAAQAMRDNMTPIRSDRSQVLDTCGTGGDGSGTFNISTAAALVTAACDVPVAKHGNRSITSKTGSADVLRELGVNIEATVEQSEHCLAEVGICFCFAPLFHASMKHVATVRRQLGFPTIFNLLGPLCNPAGASLQLLGVGRPQLRPLMAHALERLGTQRAIVVCGRDGLDEVTLAETTDCSNVVNNEVTQFDWRPEDFGLAPVENLNALKVADPQGSAEMIRQVLSGQAGPAQDIVVMNAAAALWIADRGSPSQCATQARTAINAGAAQDVLQRLSAISHQ